MKWTGVPAIVAIILSVLSAPAAAQSPGTAPPTAERPASGAAIPALPSEDTPCSPRVSWPLFTVMLDHRADLALSRAQVESLERFCLEVVREAIRRQAEFGLAFLDMVTLMRLDPADPAKSVEMPRVEAAIREMERIDADLDIAQLRAIEAGKAQLTAEQHLKLAALMTDDDPPSPRSPSTPGAPGRPGNRPGTHEGPRGEGRPGAPGGQPGPSHPAAPGRHPGHIRPFVAVRPPFWPYWYPPSVYAPPVIVEPMPPPVSYWYYCPSSGAYYPDVLSCDQPWISVPAWAQ